MRACRTVDGLPLHSLWMQPPYGLKPTATGENLIAARTGTAHAVTVQHHCAELCNWWLSCKACQQHSHDCRPVEGKNYQTNSARTLRPAQPSLQAHIPDILPGDSISGSGRMRMSAGDFVEVYSALSQAQRFDCVVTCFFLDTAHNIIQYLEIIASILKVRCGYSSHLSAPLKLI